MILPTKHIRPDRALIGVGYEILTILKEPMTMSNLWNEIRSRRSVLSPSSPITYSWFVLALDFLFIIGAVQLRRGLVQRVET